MTSKKAAKTTRPTSKKAVKVAAKTVVAKTAKKGATKGSPITKKKAAIKTPTPNHKSQEFKALPMGGPTEVTESYALAPRQDAMLQVSFDDALQVSPLLDELGRQAQFSLIHHLASHGGDLLAAALTGATVVMDHGNVLVRFTKEGSKLLKAKELRFMKDAAGKRLPTLVNRSGGFVENSRVVGPLTKGTRIAANLTIAVITVAHIISGADLAKKLNKLDSKVDFLVAAHRFDQLARLEGVYRQAKEILHLEQNGQTRLELHRLGRELFEVRSAWRREIAHKVGNLQNTEESKNRVVGFFQDLTRKGKDETVARTVSQSEVEIQLINGSLAIHVALAQAAGTLDTFLEVSLPDEIDELQRIHSLLSERRCFIHEKHPELRDRVSEVCAQLDNVTKIYRSMAMPRQTLEANPQSKQKC